MFELTATLSLSELKSLAKDCGVVPTGDKRKSATWIAAILDPSRVYKKRPVPSGTGFGATRPLKTARRVSMRARVFGDLKEFRILA